MMTPFITSSAQNKCELSTSLYAFALRSLRWIFLFLSCDDVVLMLSFEFSHKNQLVRLRKHHGVALNTRLGCTGSQTETVLRF